MPKQTDIEFARCLNTFIYQDNLRSVNLYLNRLNKNSTLKEDFFKYHLFPFISIAINSNLAYPILTRFFKENVFQANTFISYMMLIYAKERFDFHLFNSLIDIAIHQKNIVFNENDYFQLFVFSLYIQNDNCFPIFKKESVQFSLSSELLTFFSQHLYENQEKEINLSFLNSCMDEYKISFLQLLLSHFIEDKKELYKNRQIQIDYQPTPRTQISFFQKTVHNIPVIESSICQGYASLSLLERQNIQQYCKNLIHQIKKNNFDLIYQDASHILSPSEHKFLLDEKMNPIEKRYQHFISLFNHIDLYLKFENTLKSSEQSLTKKI